MAGRRPLPNATKKARGNPGRRPLPPEPGLPKKKPRQPPGMTPYATRLWRRVTPLLFEAGVLTEADQLALQTMCECASRVFEARKEVRKHGILVPGGQHGDQLKKNPAITALDAAENRLQQLMGEFGLTPAARTKVKVHEAKETDPLLLLQQASAEITNASSKPN